MQPRQKVEPLVEEILRLVAAKQEDDQLKWHEDGSVKVQVGKIIPEDSVAKRTLLSIRYVDTRERLEREHGGKLFPG
jgi:hypothetical protein